MHNIIQLFFSFSRHVISLQFAILHTFRVNQVDVLVKYIYTIWQLKMPAPFAPSKHQV